MGFGDKPLTSEVFLEGAILIQWIISAGFRGRREDQGQQQEPRKEPWATGFGKLRVRS